ncbi:MAG: glucosyl-3-phosphoglycerate synthase [Candidatus Woesearchaeota archaeon]|jgi:glucosyl-3-phosphoglycerate synthase|nr:glucosyl-3-phosphoglycerate synthase [Candidatus Woesearchaeota archaeon]MDP7623130.1 glucosyl-3-phosphoglycerate synthase [Candidatus Woesearchaeota archaeon]HJN57118.1 glucosyl-3-phosphoglycerate synthase [Candidatus Woesearchaeota archaeon]|tara:strand:+ start:29958 stop:30941 length:984 start_codon:yes stop_codon:yes gene_type:complete
MKVAEWFEKNKYKASSFSNIKKLVELKKKQKQTISICIPTLNEEKTIEKIIFVLKSKLMDKYKLVDEIIVVDSGSKDKTREIAKKAGAIVYLDSDILKRRGNFKGKGENLWKGLYAAKGDIICWIDADIKNIHPRFVYGLVGPLLTNPRISYSKPFYTRPLKVGGKTEPLGGGRVTELLVRPLFNQYFPRLSGFIQPLSGEGAARREVLEKIPYFTGYGVETAMLIDMRKKFGLRCIAQVDLYKRVHRNQNLAQLSNMSFAILQVFAKRANTLGKLIQVGSIKRKYNLIEIDEAGSYTLRNKIIADKQRRPIITLPEYRRKFKKEHN